MTVRAFALCHALRCPPPLSNCPHCFGIHRRESSPLYFPQSTSLPHAQLPSPPPPPPSSIVHPNHLIAPSCRHYHLLCIANSPPWFIVVSDSTSSPPILSLLRPTPLSFSFRLMAERHSSRSRRAFNSAAAALVLLLLLCVLLTFQITLLIGMLREREAGGISSMIDAEINVCKCKDTTTHRTHSPNLIASVLFSDDPSTLFPTLGACLSVFGADVGEITR